MINPDDFFGLAVQIVQDGKKSNPIGCLFFCVETSLQTYTESKYLTGPQRVNPSKSNNDKIVEKKACLATWYHYD